MVELAFVHAIASSKVELRTEERLLINSASRTNVVQQPVSGTALEDDTHKQQRHIREMDTVIYQSNN